MLIGVDFDNTIVCYDGLFSSVAVERKLVPEHVALSKGTVHDYLHATGQTDAWTELQGYVYGARMREATPYPGVLDFFERCRRKSVPILIISHRTRFPYLGEPYDLHRAARDWLAAYGFHDPQKVGLSADRVYFDESRRGKLARIGAAGCTHFVDDLLDLLSEPGFPAGVRKILFDPDGKHANDACVARADSWEAIDAMLGAKGDEPR